MKYLKFILFLMIVMTSCVSKKKMAYFQNTNTINNPIFKNYTPVIQIDDVLSITVSSLDPESSKSFNLFKGGGESTSAKQLTYLVDIEGNINFPVLGEIKTEGLTTNSLKKKLVKSLEKYIKNPIINVKLENFRVTVLGEVANPGVFQLKTERITILEAIGLAGDLTIEGKRKNLLLVRNINGKVERIRLDLTDESIFNSPYYYLAQNDVLYIEPNKLKLNSLSLGQTSSLISITTALISLGVILSR